MTGIGVERLSVSGWEFLGVESDSDGDFHRYRSLRKRKNRERTALVVDGVLRAIEIEGASRWNSVSTLEKWLVDLLCRDVVRKVNPDDDWISLKGSDDDLQLIAAMNPDLQIGHWIVHNINRGIKAKGTAFSGWVVRPGDGHDMERPVLSGYVRVPAIGNLYERMYADDGYTIVSTLYAIHEKMTGHPEVRNLGFVPFTDHENLISNLLDEYQDDEFMDGDYPSEFLMIPVMFSYKGENILGDRLNTYGNAGKWLAAGSDGINEAIRIASGEFVNMIDDLVETLGSLIEQIDYKAELDMYHDRFQLIASGMDDFF